MARMWGDKKSKANMNYDKLSRALRSEIMTSGIVVTIASPDFGHIW